MSINRLTYVVVLLLLAVVGYLFISLRRPMQRSEPHFVGSTRCAVCHAATDIGNQYRSWSNSPHANASRVLTTDTAASILMRKGVAIQYCLGCHTTDGGRSTDRAPLNDGVGCERCHGPGSLYSSYSVMIDRPMFLRLAGVSGNLKDCYACHRADPARDTSACLAQTLPFDAKSAWDSIAHPVPSTYQPLSRELRISP